MKDKVISFHAVVVLVLAFSVLFRLTFPCYVYRKFENNIFLMRLYFASYISIYIFFLFFSGRVAKVRSLFPSTNLLCGYKKQTGHLHHDPTGHMDISKAISGGHS